MNHFPIAVLLLPHSCFRCFSQLICLSVVLLHETNVTYYSNVACDLHIHIRHRNFKANWRARLWKIEEKFMKLEACNDLT